MKNSGGEKGRSVAKGKRDSCFITNMSLGDEKPGNKNGWFLMKKKNVIMTMTGEGGSCAELLR